MTLRKPPQTSGTLALAGFEDIFSARTPADGETVAEIPLVELHAPDPHPFMVQDDDAMSRLVESVKRDGVREPGLARPCAEGGYELLCGNRRKRACELAGLAAMPVIVRELTDVQAVLVMVDSNLQQRERILPSEKAWAYKVKMDALNHNGVKGESRSFEIMVQQTGESKNQIFRIIRLTELVEVLLNKVDARQLAFYPAVELSYLSYDEQHIVAGCMEKYEMRLSQATRLKQMKRDGTLTADAIEAVLSEEKKPPKDDPADVERFREFFPSDYSPKQINEVIVKLLSEWKFASNI